MQGLSLSSLKKHPSLIPLYACLIAGVGAACAYTIRLAVKNPDVTWNSKKNPVPQEAYKDKQYKFISPVRDYSKVKCPAPEY
ncbi:cytochrome c oxidase subunit NDUFA4 [Cephus cinctus]|uniref:Cytochrome c oxidase subunit NDUFA4 n=1 Tax=Cephus cinctus TaxID=211228 RepID=A0AAJ7BNH7_CEPCN|nr:cytochrome c oxidase subunit NDUFA4 [Cephus cinctus]